MPFTNLNLKFSYKSEDDNLLKDFYLPVLKLACSYDRAVGYFSAGILNQLSSGIKSLVLSGGTMRLIIGDVLNQDEFDAVKNTELLDLKQKELFERLDSYLFESNDNQNGLKILSWLIATKKLTIKFALRRKGMYHQKVGVIRDINSNIIVFHGSANETPSALNDEFNSEEISIYPSYDSSFESHGKGYINSFEQLWNNKASNTRVIDITSLQYKHLSDKALSLGVSKVIENINDDLESLESDDFPKLPSNYKGHVFSLFEHQDDALRAWRENEYHGLLKLATGAGKTVTSIFGAVSLFQERFLREMNTVLMVSVPYIELADQWAEELGLFNIVPHKCYQSRESWDSSFLSSIQLFQMGLLPFLCVVVVNKTLVSAHFQKYICMLDFENLIMIGDECHHHGSQGVHNALPAAKFRIGLSATPFNSEEEEVETPFSNDSKQNILEYYDRIVYEYSLADAIADNVLTPYIYNIVPCYLSPDEQGMYDKYSASIAKLIIISRARALKVGEKTHLSQLCGNRSRLLGSANEKLEKLKSIASLVPDEKRKHTLFYAGEGKHPEEDVATINLVSKTLNNVGWKTSQFTSNEGSLQRKQIMGAFKDSYLDGLVAMKVLDEGIDIPICDTAYILASTRNPRQYVQRRGRILRKAKGKCIATIYDFIILPSEGGLSQYSEQLKKAELERVQDFMSLCYNKDEVKYKLESLGVCYVDS